jgi:hypothetical protein
MGKKYVKLKLSLNTCVLYKLYFTSCCLFISSFNSVKELHHETFIIIVLESRGL